MENEGNVGKGEDDTLGDRPENANGRGRIKAPPTWVQNAVERLFWYNQSRKLRLTSGIDKQRLSERKKQLEGTEDERGCCVVLGISWKIRDLAGSCVAQSCIRGSNGQSPFGNMLPIHGGAGNHLEFGSFFRSDTTVRDPLSSLQPDQVNRPHGHSGKANYIIYIVTFISNKW
jgi:hypothetical protein